MGPPWRRLLRVSGRGRVQGTWGAAPPVALGCTIPPPLGGAGVLAGPWGLAFLQLPGLGFCILRLDERGVSVPGRWWPSWRGGYPALGAAGGGGPSGQPLAGARRSGPRRPGARPRPSPPALASLLRSAQGLPPACVLSCPPSLQSAGTTSVSAKYSGRSTHSCHARLSSPGQGAGLASPGHTGN